MIPQRDRELEAYARGYYDGALMAVCVALSCVAAVSVVWFFHTALSHGALPIP